MRPSILTGILAGAALAALPPSSMAQAPAAGSGGGGPVGPSITQPNAPTGAPPPGTPGGQAASDLQSRTAVGAAVLGKTETPGTGVPGDTGGGESGVKK